MKNYGSSSEQNMRRSAVDILADILAACQRGEKITRIMLRAGLNYPQARKYLSAMLDAGLLATAQGASSSIYETTPSGLRFLFHYAKMVRLLSGEEGGSLEVVEEMPEIHVEAISAVRDDAEPSLVPHQRSPYDLVACILINAIDGSTLGDLGRRCMMNHFQARKYTRHLIGLGLLVRSGFNVKGRTIMTTTDRGLDYLASYAQLYMVSRTIHEGNHF